MATLLFWIWFFGALALVVAFYAGKYCNLSWLKARSHYLTVREENNEVLLCAVLWPVLLVMGGIQWSFGSKDKGE